MKIELEAESWMQHPEMGWIAYCRSPIEFVRDEHPFFANEVFIDGNPYTVRGAELQCTVTIRVGSPMGILIEGEPKFDD